MTVLASVLCLALVQAPASRPASRPTSTKAEGYLVVLHKRANTLSLFDPTTGENLHTSPTGEGPHEAAATPDGRLVVVCDYGHQQPGRTLTVFDVADREVVRTIDLGKYRRPHGIVMEPDGRHALVTVEVNQAIIRVDIWDGAVVSAYETDQAASHMVVTTPSPARAWVANIASGSVSVIDLEEGRLEQVIRTGAGAEGIDATPDGSQVWVGNRSANTVTVIDAGSLETLATLPCATFPIRVKITLDGKHALVSNAQSADVSVFDVATRAEIARIPMKLSAVEESDGRLFSGAGFQGPVPVGLLLHPNGKLAYIANTNADIVTAIDLSTWKVVDRIATGPEPDGMAWTSYVR